MSSCAGEKADGVWLWLQGVTVLRLNFLIGLCGLVTGAIVAGVNGARLVPPAPLASPLAADYFAILATNERVLVSMVLGLPVLGVYGNLVVLSNWFRFGSDCVAIMRGSGTDLAYIFIHGPLELAVFTLGSAAVQGAAYSGARSLVLKTTFEWRAWVWRYAVAAVLLVPVAALEVLSKWVRASALR